MLFPVERIKQIVPLSADEAELIGKLFIEKSIKKGEHFLSEGQVCRWLAIIHSGLVRYYINDDGSERTYYFNWEGDFVCDYESFIPQAPSNKNIQAVEDSLLYVISFEGLQRIYQEVQAGERLGRLGIEQVFVRVIQQLSSLYNDLPPARYDRFLETFAAISQRVPQYHVASYIGIKPQSLSRIRKKGSRQR